MDAKGWQTMSDDEREITEGIQFQGADEIVIYALTVSNWGTTLATADGVKVFDITDGARTDVTTTVMPVTTMTVSGNKITFSPLKLLTAGRTYRLEVLFTIDGQKLEAHSFIVAEN
jgi:hypothetical protein